MADKVHINITINGNTDTNWTTTETAVSNVLAAFTAAGVSSSFEAQVAEGNMSVAHTLVDSNTITFTYSWEDVSLVSSFWESADFTASKTVFADNNWTSTGSFVTLDDTTTTFSF